MKLSIALIFLSVFFEANCASDGKGSSQSEAGVLEDLHPGREATKGQGNRAGSGTKSVGNDNRGESGKSGAGEKQSGKTDQTPDKNPHSGSIEFKNPATAKFSPFDDLKLSFTPDDYPPASQKNITAFCVKYTKKYEEQQAAGVFKKESGPVLKMDQFSNCSIFEKCCSDNCNKLYKQSCEGVGFPTEQSCMCLGAQKPAVKIIAVNLTSTCMAASKHEHETKDATKKGKLCDEFFHCCDKKCRTNRKVDCDANSDDDFIKATCTCMRKEPSAETVSWGDGTGSLIGDPYQQNYPVPFPFLISSGHVVELTFQ